MVAANQGHHKCVSILLDNGANVNLAYAVIVIYLFRAKNISEIDFLCVPSLPPW